MAKYAVNAVNATDLAALLSPLANATAIAELEWSTKKPRCHVGRITVHTKITGCRVGQLQLYFVEQRPDRMHAQYLFNNIPVRRLDVNDRHRTTDETHKHTYIPRSGSDDDVYVPDDIPAVPLGPTVAPGTYRRVFEAFAAECFIALPDGYWTEPLGR